MISAWTRLSQGWPGCAINRFGVDPIFERKEKSLMWSYGSLMRAGVIACEPIVHNMIV